VDAVIVNRLLPDGVHDPFFAKWRKTQEQFLEEARGYFDPVPVFTLPLRDDQVLGTAALVALGRDLWAGKDPALSFRSDPPYRYAKRAGKYILTLNLPFLDKNEVDLAMASGDLVVRIGNVRHHIPVPRTLVGFSPAGAAMENGRLTVRFERPLEAR
jgi:arsenite/tail-anchored protein-transporting ATPase